jgi:hypothetical protein
LDPSHFFAQPLPIKKNLIVIYLTPSVQNVVCDFAIKNFTFVKKPGGKKKLKTSKLQIHLNGQLSILSSAS